MNITIHLTRAANIEKTNNTKVILPLTTYAYLCAGREIGTNAPIEAFIAQYICSYTLGYYYACRGKTITDESTKYQALILPNNWKTLSFNSKAEWTESILTYNGKCIDTPVFSKNNGGQTISSKERWGGERPYLLSQKDPYDSLPRYGHGVGLSQQGAIARAKSGQLYQNILAFYFPGTEITYVGGDNMAKKIHSTDLINEFKSMYEPTPWIYEWGAAREGCVDCSGAFVYAYKKLGGPSIPHSSNAISRQSCGALQKNTTNIAPKGWAAFKWKEQTDPTLLQKYGKDDYYHMGLVDESGQYVLNAKGTKYGFCRDKLDKSWQYIAPLKDAIYDEVDNILDAKYVARVTTDSTPLRVRATPSSDGTQIGKLPKGTLVDVYDDTNAEWWKIGYDGLIGYASATYLTKVGGVDGEDDDTQPKPEPSPSDDYITISLTKDMAYELFEILHNALGND